MFKENELEKIKDQSYQDREVLVNELGDKNFIIEMYNKQYQLQKLMKDKGRTLVLPDITKDQEDVTKECIYQSVYHFFCMQTEEEELRAEFNKCAVSVDAVKELEYELIDIVFFLFNTGIYAGIDINKVVNSNCRWWEYEVDEIYTIKELVDMLNSSVINFIDKLPWKSWRTYDMDKWLNEDRIKNNIWDLYAECINLYLKLSWRLLTSHHNNFENYLYGLYCNKWQENWDRQFDKNKGYV